TPLDERDTDWRKNGFGFREVSCAAGRKSPAFALPIPAQIRCIIIPQGRRSLQAYQASGAYRKQGAVSPRSPGALPLVAPNRTIPAMQTCDTLIIPAWCIPVAPADSVLTETAVAVSEGRIIDILPTESARERYQAREIVTRPNHVLIPGLINAHTHAAMT